MNDDRIEELTKEVMAAIEPLVRKELERRIDEVLYGAFGRRRANQPVETERRSLSAAAVSREIAGGLAKAKAERSRGELSLDAVIAALTAAGKSGLRSEQIRERMGLASADRRRLSAVLGDGLGAGKIRKKGQKRATTYFAK